MDVINRIEDIIHFDIGGRGLGPLWEDLKLQGDSRLHQLHGACSKLLNTKSVLVVTGFFILSAKTTETDGPPGALAIARALAHLNKSVAIVTDQITAAAIKKMIAKYSHYDPTVEKIDVIVFPIADIEKSAQFAKSLLEERGVDGLISIECPSPTTDGTYRNMRGLDISEFTAKMDQLFAIAQSKKILTIGIGVELSPPTLASTDGGNEIGMANLGDLIVKYVPHGELIKAAMPCDYLISAGVSNWGGYAVNVALFNLHALNTGEKLRNMLPSIEIEEELTAIMIEEGLVDGVSAKAILQIDGFSFDSHKEVIAKLLSQTL